MAKNDYIKNGEEPANPLHFLSADEQLKIEAFGLTKREAFEILKKEINQDKELAFAWHSNIAMSVYDSIGVVITDSKEHEEQLRLGNESATRFMKICFDAETSQDMLTKRQINMSDIDKARFSKLTNEYNKLLMEYEELEEISSQRKSTIDKLSSELGKYKRKENKAK